MSYGRWLRRKPSGWYFRRSVPLRVRVCLKRQEISVNLSTINANQAKAIARLYGMRSEILFAETQNQPYLAPADIEKLIALHADDEDARFEVERLRSTTSLTAVKNRRQALKAERDVLAELTAVTEEAAREGRCILDHHYIMDLVARAGIDRQAATAGYDQISQALAESLATATANQAATLDAELKALGNETFASKLRARVISLLCGHPDPIIKPAPPSRPADLVAPTVDAPFTSVPTPSAPQQQATVTTTAPPSMSQSPEPTVQPQIGGVPPEAVPESQAISNEVSALTNPLLRELSTPPLQVVSDQPATSQSQTISGEILPPIKWTQVGVPTSSFQVTVNMSMPAAGLPGAVIPQKLFSEVWQTYIDKAMKFGTFKESRRRELKASGSGLIWIYGDYPLDHYTPEVMDSFRAKFMDLPADYKNIRIDPENRKHQYSYEEVMVITRKMRAEIAVKQDLTKEDKKLRKRFAPLSPKTLNKHYSNLKPVIGEEALKGLFLKVDKT